MGDCVVTLIGIIVRQSVSEKGHRISVVYDDLISAVRASGGVPVMIPDSTIDTYFELCNGFILQGGDDISENNLTILAKLRDKNVPTLGICLGMQEMGFLTGGKLVDVSGHNVGFNHEINVFNDSLLYRILGKEKITVNSRHNSAIVSPKIKVAATALDGVIEAIYDDSLDFFLGVEWHPENMYNSDVFAKKIFDYFIKICDDKHVSR